jgi:MFS family permease
VIGAAIGGAGNGGIFASSKTLLQQYTPQRWMAMITGLNEGAIQAAPALGITLGGVIAAAAEPRLALGIAAVGSLAYVFGVWALIRPSLLPDPPSRIPDHPPEPRRDHAVAGLEVERGETVA